MADYIYLLHHRLSNMQRKALEAVREAARALAAPVFLAGGAVRDLTSGAPVRDLDFAVQGDVSALVSPLETAGAVQAGENAILRSLYFIFPGGVRVEISPTVTVSYPKPGKPEVHTAAILDDLRRRDFTANAMAVSLNPGSYGLLLDPLNGVADLENRELRLVSNLGFIEQPALLFRAARLSGRLGWTLEERTQRRYDNAREEGVMEHLSAAARGYELEELFHEEDPVAAIEHLETEGWLNDLLPALAGLKFDRDGLDKVRDTLGLLEQQGISTDPSPVYFPLLTSKLLPDQVAALKSGFPRQGFVQQIDSMEARTKDLSTQLGAKTAATPSATWKLLFSAEPEVVLALASGTRSSTLQAKFKSFFGEWPAARQRIPYALMQEMRITPDIPGYDRLLEDLFFALIDGKLSTPEETKAFLEPYSPPAPAQQTPPRRKPAKAARGRGRQAAAAVVPEEEAEAETEADDAESLYRPDTLSGQPNLSRASDELENTDEQDDSEDQAEAEVQAESEDETDSDELAAIDKPTDPAQLTGSSARTEMPKAGQPKDRSQALVTTELEANGPGEPSGKKIGSKAKQTTTPSEPPAAKQVELPPAMPSERLPAQAKDAREDGRLGPAAGKSAKSEAKAAGRASTPEGKTPKVKSEPAHSAKDRQPSSSTPAPGPKAVAGKSSLPKLPAKAVSAGSPVSDTVPAVSPERAKSGGKVGRGQLTPATPLETATQSAKKAAGAPAGDAAKPGIASAKPGSVTTKPGTAKAAGKAVKAVSAKGTAPGKQVIVAKSVQPAVKTVPAKRSGR